MLRHLPFPVTMRVADRAADHGLDRVVIVRDKGSSREGTMRSIVRQASIAVVCLGLSGVAIAASPSPSATPDPWA